MQLSRRTLTRVALVTPAALALGAVAAPPAAAVGSRYSRSTWEPLLGRTFTLQGSELRGRAVLVAVDDLTAAPRGAAHRFSLVFRAEQDLPVGQVTIRRRGFRSVSLFVSPVDRGLTTHHRQAVINRI